MQKIIIDDSFLIAHRSQSGDFMPHKNRTLILVMVQGCENNKTDINN